MTAAGAAPHTRWHTFSAARAHVYLLPLANLLLVVHPIPQPDRAQLFRLNDLALALHDMDEIAAVEFLLNKMKDTKTNNEFFESMKK